MKKLQIEFAAFKEKLEALNEILKEQSHSIEERIQGLRKETEENKETLSTYVQNQSIRNKLVSLEQRIRRLEALNQAKDTKVISPFKFVF